MNTLDVSKDDCADLWTTYSSRNNRTMDNAPFISRVKPDGMYADKLCAGLQASCVHIQHGIMDVYTYTFVS